MDLFHSVQQAAASTCAVAAPPSLISAPARSCCRFDFSLVILESLCFRHCRIIIAAVHFLLLDACDTRFAVDGHSKRLLQVSPRCRMAGPHARAARIRRRTRNFAGGSRSIFQKPAYTLPRLITCSCVFYHFAYSFVFWLHLRVFCSAWCRKTQSEWLQPPQSYNFDIHTHSRNALSK